MNNARNQSMYRLAATLKVVILCLAVFNLIFGLVSYAHAAANSNQEPRAGTLYITDQQSNRQAAINLNTHVEMSISGLTARVKVTQVFENSSDRWVEGKYLFPLPEKAAVDHLTMKIGDRLVVGEIKEKKQAKKIYLAAKISGRKASLVEQHRPNLFTNSVANIGPYETIEIVIEYQQDVIYNREQGFSIRFPMAVTPRYQPISVYRESFDPKQSANSSNGRFRLEKFNLLSEVDELFPEPLKNQSRAVENLATIQIQLDAGFALEQLNSPSHKLNSQQKTESLYQISFARNNVKSDRDFILNWKPVSSAQPRAAIFTESKGEDKFLSLMLLPPSMDTLQSDATASQNEINREIILVIDTSGSMGGESIRQAKSALRFALSTLKQGDRFNIIQFNSTTSQLFSSARLASKRNLYEAKRYVDFLKANGGTEMFSAVEASLDGCSDHQLVRQVIFLTDGAISNESQLFSLIDKTLGDSRLFTVGIGSAPNTFFMKKAARFGKGTFTFIADTSRSEEKMTQLFDKISRPQLTHINIDWPEKNFAEVWPKRIPDLFDGKPLWIKAKVTEFNGRVAVSGRIGNRLWQSDLPLDNSIQQPGVSVLWAREKIAGIMNSAFHGAVSAAQKNQIIETALKHHIVSRFTSLVAVDKTPSRTSEFLKSVKVRGHTPKGSSSAHPQGASMRYPKTSLDLDIKARWTNLLFLISLIGFLLTWTKQN